MARGGSATSMSLLDLENMIAESRRALRRLERLRAGYQRKLDRLELRITLISGNGYVRRGRRARNRVSLPDAIADVLTGASAPLSVGDIAEQVQAAGYRSGSAKFRNIVNQALIKDRRFISEARGVYRPRASRRPDAPTR